MTSFHGPLGLRLQSNHKTTHSLPQLYAVANGSYASNANYGSGAVALTGSFDQYTIAEKCSHMIRKEQNKQTQFSTTLSLASEGFPVGLPASDGEVRIRTKWQQPLTIYHTTPVGDVLNPFDPSTVSPLFDECQISTDAPIFAFPVSTGGLGQLKARLLNSGDLALVNVNYTLTNDVNTTPILVSDISSLMGEGQGVTTLNIEGYYL